MFSVVKNAVAAAALVGLVASQPALAVRSADSLPAPGAKIAALPSRVASPVKSSDELVGIPAIGFVIGALIFAAVVVAIATDKNHDKSPG